MGSGQTLMKPILNSELFCRAYKGPTLCSCILIHIYLTSLIYFFDTFSLSYTSTFLIFGIRICAFSKSINKKCNVSVFPASPEFASKQGGHLLFHQDLLLLHLSSSCLSPVFISWRSFSENLLSFSSLSSLSK